MEESLVSQEIKCPNCGTAIQLTQALSNQVSEQLKQKFEKEYTAKLQAEKGVLAKQFAAEAEEKANAENLKLKKQLQEQEASLKTRLEESSSRAAGEKAELEKMLAEKQIQLNQADKLKEALAKKEKEIEQKEKFLELEYEDKMKAAKAEFEKKAIEKAKEENEFQLKDMLSQIEELKSKNKSATEEQLNLMKKQRELESEKENLLIENERKLSEERRKIHDELLTKVKSESDLKLREKDEQMDKLKATIEKLQKQTELTSQQLQGEVQELILEELLKEKFPDDLINPVAKGVRGADVIQIVKNKFGNVFGKIIWESKRTKSWSNDWIRKIKDDQREEGAEIAIIVSQKLPEKIELVGQIENVWVISFTAIEGITIALRELLMKVNNAKNSALKINSEMENLYQYLCGPKFTQRIEFVVRTFMNMQEDLNKEKRSITRIWERREEQIAGAVKNTASMYGELQGIIGNALPDVPTLELP